MVNLASRLWFALRLNPEDLGRMKLEKVPDVVSPKPGLFPELPNCSFDARFPFFRFSSGKPIIRPRTAHEQDSFFGFNNYRASAVVVCAWNIFTPLKRLCLLQVSIVNRSLFPELLKTSTIRLTTFFVHD